MKILVSGQGFAGSLLSWYLIQAGCDVTVVDHFNPASSTRVSAGIMLPVTGRRLAKTQNADVIIPAAHQLYREIEIATGFKFFTPKNVLQLFNSTANRNEWYARSADPGMVNYAGEILNHEQINTSIKNEFGGIILKQSGSINPLFFLDAMQNYLKAKGAFLNEKLHINQLDILPSGVRWNNNEYDYVVFCEGFDALQTGYFKYLPLKPAKGEILDFYSEQLPEDNILVSGNYILPMGDHKFRIGATYQWENLNTEITVEAALELETNLRSLISCDYKITGQQAGIRPSVRDRRPLLGFHPEHKMLAVFNGLGTKGAMQGPFYAKQMSELLTKGILPDADTNISRFESLYPGH